MPRTERHQRSYSRLTWGSYVARDPVKYSGVSTPLADRSALGIRGLVPPAYIPLELDVQRCVEQLRSKETLLEKYLYLAGIQDVSERLYYAILVKHTAEVMPIVYTPGVGLVCQNFSAVYRGTLRGMYLSLDDAGTLRSLLDNWPTADVSTIVVTDGERILGLGDLGVNGMGIPIGKLALYTACAGINPSHVLPVTLDVGTENDDLLEDPYYLGLRQRRERGPAYDDLVEEFVVAAQDKFGPDVLVQFEDFGNKNAFRLLEKWQTQACAFNDDIQGTAAVCLAGLIASERITDTRLKHQTFLFAGAGEAGTGIANLIAYAVSQESQSDDNGTDNAVTVQEAREKIFLVDSHGLVTKVRLEAGNAGSRPKLQDHKVQFAHAVAQECPTLEAAVELLRPTVLIGVSAIAGIFTKEILDTMASMNDRPVIMALSNPTSQAECTAQQAYESTDGRAIFSSGSPFDPVTLADGRRFVPGQGNNAYIFPGIGLGHLAAGSTRITDHDMYVAAKTLADQVTDADLAVGSLYPPLEKIRDVSAHIAVAVAVNAHATGVATEEEYPLTLPTEDADSTTNNNNTNNGNGDKKKKETMLQHVRSLMYDPFEDPFKQQE